MTDDAAIDHIIGRALATLGSAPTAADKISLYTAIELTLRLLAATQSGGTAAATSAQADTAQSTATNADRLSDDEALVAADFPFPV